MTIFVTILQAFNLKLDPPIGLEFKEFSLAKSLEKVWIFNPKNVWEPCTKQTVFLRNIIYYCAMLHPVF